MGGMNLSLVAFICFVVGLAIGLLVGHMAHAALAPEHHWISDNPHYTIPPAHTTHCCGPDHCKPARLMHLKVERDPQGGYWVIGTQMKDGRQFVPEGYVYQTEADGNGEFWVCVTTWPHDQMVLCLFVPPQGM